MDLRASSVHVPARRHHGFAIYFLRLDLKLERLEHGPRQDTACSGEKGRRPEGSRDPRTARKPPALSCRSIRRNIGNGVVGARMAPGVYTTRSEPQPRF